MTRPIAPNKLLHSKWTASKPVNKEKHFIVVELLRDNNNAVQQCVIEAVFSNKQYCIGWRELKVSSKWLQGWQ